MNDRTLTVNEVERNFPPPGRGSQRPEAGNEFVRVHVTLTNTSSRTFNVNPLDFELRDSNGVQRNREGMSGLPENFTLGSLAPEGVLSGNLVFEAPQGDPDLKLVYQPAGARDIVATVNL